MQPIIISKTLTRVIFLDIDYKVNWLPFDEFYTHIVFYSFKRISFNSLPFDLLG